MKKHTTAVLICLLVAFTRVASAATINFVGEGKVGVVDIHSPALGDIWVYAGELEWQWAGGGSPFYTYCVDANHWTLNSQDVTVQPSSALTTPGVTDAGGKAAWLVNNFAPWVHSSGSGDDAAALQVAIWTALYNSGSTLNSGPFKLLSANSYITTHAQSYLSALYSAPGGGYYSSSALFLDAPAGYGQDQMPIPTIPEPSTLLLFGGGIGCLVARIRRRSKN